jgi:uncharacterized protein YfdQ (DUF2303 family)
MENSGNLAALLEMARDIATSQNALVELPNGKSAQFLPQGYSVREFSPELSSHVISKITFDDANSFIEYLNKYKNIDGECLLLASSTNNVVMSVLDYHQPFRSETIPSDVVGMSDITVNHCSHIAAFCPTFSEQYARWRDIDEKPMTQAAFAEFVEEFCRDIIDPAPATMMTIASDLEMSSSLEFKSKTNTQNGMVELAFVEKGSATTKEGVPIPKQFSLSVPVFFGETEISIPVFLRFRAVKGGAVQFAIKIQDRETIEREAFLRSVHRIGDGVEIVPLLGRLA